MLLKRDHKGMFTCANPLHKKELYELYVEKCISQKAIAVILNCSQAYISKKLTEYNIKKRNYKGFRVKAPFKLTDILMEVLCGALLGDGCMFSAKQGNCNFSYRTSVKEHNLFIANFLKGMLVDVCTEYKTYDSRTRKTYTSYLTRTSNNVLFNIFRDMWYPYNKKRVPNINLITPRSLLIWYIGDGCLNRNNGSIKLCTNGFDVDNINEVLLPQLSDFCPHISRTDKEGQYVIIIPRMKVKSFLNFIGPPPFDDISYKWNFLEYVNKGYAKGKPNYSQLYSDFRDLYKKGHTYYSIAKKFGVNAKVVQNHLVRAGLYKKRGAL